LKKWGFSETRFITNETMRMQVFRIYWQPTSQEKKTNPISANPPRKCLRQIHHQPKNWDEVPSPNQLLPNQKTKMILHLTSLMEFGMVVFGTIVLFCK
jgi:hypothetical protein